MNKIKMDKRKRKINPLSPHSACLITHMIDLFC